MNGSRKCYIKIYLSEEIAVVKSIKVKNILSVTICSLIMDQNFMGHNLLVLCLNIIDITNITVKCIDYFCINFDITNSDTILLLGNSLNVLGELYKMQIKKFIIKNRIIIFFI